MNNFDYGSYIMINTPRQVYNSRHPKQGKGTQAVCYYNYEPIKEEKKNSTFQDGIKSTIDLARFNHLVMKKGKIAPKKLQKMNQDDRSTLTKLAQIALGNEADELPNVDDVAKCSYNLKKHFDERYGEDKYRIISIGTSPAMIAEGMEYLGADVAYVPISGLNKPPLDKDDCAFGYNDDNLRLALEYLRRNELYERDNKMNIILDYSASGQTLDIMNSSIRQFFRLPSNLVGSCDIISTLRQIAAKPQDKKNPMALDNATVDRVSYNMATSSTEKISNVPHFNIKAAEKEDAQPKRKPKFSLFRKFDKFSQAIAKTYYILMADKLDRYMELADKLL